MFDRGARRGQDVVGALRTRSTALIPWLIWTLLLGWMRRQAGEYHPPVGETPLGTVAPARRARHADPVLPDRDAGAVQAECCERARACPDRVGRRRRPLGRTGAHEALLGLVAQHSCFAWAAARYKERAGDPVADAAARARCAARRVATMFATREYAQEGAVPRAPIRQTLCPRSSRCCSRLRDGHVRRLGDRSCHDSGGR